MKKPTLTSRPGQKSRHPPPVLTTSIYRTLGGISHHLPQSFYAHLILPIAAPAAASLTLMAMGDLFHTVSVLVNTCTKHMSRATRRVWSHRAFSTLALSKNRAAPFFARGASFIPFLEAKKKGVKGKGDDDTNSKSSEEEEETVEEEGLWQKTILMGEKCQPLDFSGVIYYDSAGRQLKEPPTPRSPFRSPLRSFAFHDAAVHAEEVAEDN